MKPCLIIQPIHEAGIAALERIGLSPRFASQPDMKTVAREITDAVAVITRNAGLNREAISEAKELRVIGNHGVGVDPIDVAYATEQGIPVVNTPFTNAQSVAELAVTLALAVTKHLVVADKATRSGNFSFKHQASIVELGGKTAGIIGYGIIGQRTAAMLRTAFNMTILVYSPSANADTLNELGIKKCETLPELLKNSDLVSVHVPLTSQTRALIGEVEFKQMRPNAIFINTARGPVVDEQALLRALQARQIFGAGLDVYLDENMPLDDPLLRLENVILSPHIGGASREALKRTAEKVVEQMAKALGGVKPEHLINPLVWAKRRTWN